MLDTILNENPHIKHLIKNNFEGKSREEQLRYVLNYFNMFSTYTIDKSYVIQFKNSFLWQKESI